jgi:DNA invertase Pin-like site-specific DNA recombinase
MRIVGYARVSTGKDANAGSIEAQEDAIRGWARTGRHEVVAVHHDAGKSGALDATERPGLLAALGVVEAGKADALVVHRLDRLARALHVQEAVLARAWQAQAGVWEVVGDRQVLHDDPDDPMRTFVRQVMGAASQLERGLVRARMQGGRRRKQGHDGYAGGFVPYGWAVVGSGKAARLVEVEEEQRQLKRMAAMRRRGRTLRQIADRLNADGVPARRGGPWRHTSVRSALRRVTTD